MNPQFAEFCTSHGIRIREASADRVILDNVPVNAALLTKPRTNLCAARESTSGQFVVWVDADLRARAGTSPLGRLLSGQLKGEWQLVTHPQCFATAQQAIVQTIELLAHEEVIMKELADHGPLPGEMLPLVATRIDPNAARPDLFHRDGVIELAGRLFLDGPGLVVLAGPSGSGLTCCAAEVLGRCRQRPQAGTAAPQIIRIDCALAASEMLYPASTDERLRRLLGECLAFPQAWFLLDNVQWPLRGGPLAQAALAVAIERRLRAIATFQTDMPRPAEMLPNLVRRMHWLELPALDSIELAEILARRAGRLKSAQEVEVEREALRTCLQMSSHCPGADPGRCLTLLEAAAALALGSKPGRIGPDEVAAVETTSTVQT
jgi:hypothetical protein